ncbi:hypothetical protein IEQ34_004024 [Dendrobium chrysotoxum]|uniref:Uncharacterized protein n=1 Tax=Dendrobium chrysotoxum TaxID=161865 RepID=A0AAV7HCQ3_DENCH|nr:hypothetical protein IEQ34_004024 [Dendrobium chrysotoxum]
MKALFPSHPHLIYHFIPSAFWFALLASVASVKRRRCRDRSIVQHLPSGFRRIICQKPQYDKTFFNFQRIICPATAVWEISSDGREFKRRLFGRSHRMAGNLSDGCLGDLIGGIIEAAVGVIVLIDVVTMKIKEGISVIIGIGNMMIEAGGLGAEVLVIGKDVVGAPGAGIIEAQLGKVVLKGGPKLSNGTGKAKRQNMLTSLAISITMVAMDPVRMGGTIMNNHMKIMMNTFTDLLRFQVQMRFRGDYATCNESRALPEVMATIKIDKEKKTIIKKGKGEEKAFPHESDGEKSSKNAPQNSIKAD